MKTYVLVLVAALAVNTLGGTVNLWPFSFGFTGYTGGGAGGIGATSGARDSVGAGGAPFGSAAGAGGAQLGSAADAGGAQLRPSALASQQQIQNIIDASEV